MLRKIKNNKGAIELSIGTIVIIVIAMSMLILGLVLVRNIFTGSTESVDALNQGVMDEITELFTDEDKSVVVQLGTLKTATVKQGDSVKFAIGASTLDGSSTNRDRLKYELSLDESGDCIGKIGKQATEALIVNTLDAKRSFQDYDGSNAFTLIEIKVPKGTATCTQPVLIDVTDTETNQPVGGSSFLIEIVKSGIF